jgi:hypothetical protein
MQETSQPLMVTWARQINYLARRAASPLACGCKTLCNLFKDCQIYKRCINGDTLTPGDR